MFLIILAIRLFNVFFIVMNQLKLKKCLNAENYTIFILITK